MLKYNRYLLVVRRFGVIWCGIREEEKVEQEKWASCALCSIARGLRAWKALAGSWHAPTNE